MQWKRFLPYLLSFLLLAAIIRFIDVNAVWSQATAFGVIPSLLFMALYAANFFFRAVKWKYLLKPFADVKLSDSYHYTMVGFFANNLLPARIGELIRAYALSRKTGLGKAKCFATVIVDRVTDGTALIGLFALAFLLSEKVPEGVDKLVLLPAALFAALFAAFLFPQKMRQLFKPFIRRLPLLREKIDFLFEETIVGGKALRGNQKRKAVIWGSSAAVWALHVVSFYYAAQQMNLGLGLLDIGLMTALASFAVMVPAAPGYIGTYEAAVVAFFVAYGLDVNQGLAYAVVTHVLQLLAITLMGYYSVHKLGLKVAEVLQNKEAGRGAG